MKSRVLFGIVAPALFVVACSQSDAGITTSVKSQLVADDMVKARSIDVDTSNRIVTLKGQVMSSDEEFRAIQIARNTKGVADVIDQLSIAPGDRDAIGTSGSLMPSAVGDALSDAAITASVKSQLLADSDTSGLRIDVDTSQKVVTLTGTLPTQAQKTEALRIAEAADGVSSVVDRLRVGR